VIVLIGLTRRRLATFPHHAEPARPARAWTDPAVVGRRVRQHPTRDRDTAMSIGKQIAHKAEAAKGTVKKLLGRTTGSTRLRTEGHLDQARGNTNQAGDKLKNAFKR